MNNKEVLSRIDQFIEANSDAIFRHIARLVAQRLSNRV